MNLNFFLSVTLVFVRYIPYTDANKPNAKPIDNKVCFLVFDEYTGMSNASVDKILSRESDKMNMRFNYDRNDDFSESFHRLYKE